MKLTWDVFVVLIKAFATLVLGMTLMAAGAYLWGQSQTTSDALRVKLTELHKTREQAKIDFDKAARAQAEALQNRVDRSPKLSSTINEAQDKILTAKNTIIQNEKDKSSLESQSAVWRSDISQDYRSWKDSIEQRNTVFKQSCAKSGWPESKCIEILTRAKLEPITQKSSQNMSYNQWTSKVKAEVNRECQSFFAQTEAKIPDELAFVLRWKTCESKQTRLLRTLTALDAFHAAAQRYKEIEQRIVDARETEVTALASQRKAQKELSDLENEVNKTSLDVANAQHVLNQSQTQLSDALSNPRVLLQNFLLWWWEKVRPYFFTVLGVLLAMVLWRPLIYFCIAPLAGKLPSVGLLPRAPRPRILRSEYAEAESETPELSPPARLRVTADQRKQLVYLKPNEKLWVRPDYVVSSRGGGAQWIYGGWQHPFTSYAAGLVGMTVFDGSKPGQDRGIAIAGTGEAYANAYITRVELTNHPGFVLRTSHVVAMQGQLKIRARWSFQPVSLLRGQVRYMVAEGTGSIYFVGYGGAFPHTPSKHLPFNTPEHAETAALDDRHGFTENMQAPLADAHANDNANTENVIHQLHDGLVIGWDARLEFGLERNENWIDVAVRRRSAMFESSFKGEGIYITTNAVKTRSKDVAGRMLEAILGTLGKILGI